jgi:excisionase family DNA binding protein
MATTNDGEGFVTVAEVARHYAVTVRTVRNWIRRGELPAVKIKRMVRVPRWALTHPPQKPKKR